MSERAHTPATPDQRRAAVRLLWQATVADRGAMRTAALWLALASALEALAPVLFKAFIDRHLLPHQGPLSSMAALLGAALVAGCVASLLRYVQLVRLAGVAMRSVRHIRNAVYAHVLRLPMAFFDRAITGQLVSRVTNDTEAIKGLYVQVLFVMLDSVITLAGVLLTMVWLDWRLTAVVALLLPTVVGIVWLYQRWSAPAVAATRALRSDLNAQTSESIAGMAVLQATGAGVAFGQRYTQTNEAHWRARMGELRANAWLLRPALDLLSVVVLAAVIAAFGSLGSGASAGSTALQVGVLYAFVRYLGRVVEPLIQITMQFSQLQQALVAASRVNALLNEAPATGQDDDLRIRQGGISIRALDFGYAPGTPVLHGLNLDIAPGQFVGIVGPTGSGKSTLLSLLLRFYDAPPGSIRFDGVALADLGDTAFRTAVGLVPQEPFLLAASARDNIDMGRQLPTEQLHAAARDARALAFIERLPQGWDTPLGEGGARLSVGEKQLIAMARALAGQPRILLLDEATSHIDSETEAQVQLALGALRGKVTVVAIAHRLSTIREADRIVVLNHGHIAEAGSHAELMAHAGGLYQRLVQLQQLQGEDAAEPPTHQ